MVKQHKSGRGVAVSKTMAADTARLPEGDIGLHGIDHEGRGVGRWQGKAVFVAGALPGETVRWRLQQDKKSFALGEMV